MKIISFGSRREDYNNLSILSEGTEMMTPPRARLVQQAISSISKDNSPKHLDYLFNVAKNNKYGLLPNSALRAYLERNSAISEKFENNDWSEELQNLIKKAIKRLPKTRREKFLDEYYRIFVEQQNLTGYEHKLVKFREKIISSEPFKKAQEGNEEISEPLKNLDYFIASSETPTKTKVYILSKLNYFLSPDYKIDEQLKDKKFQVFSEIVNDLVIKRPDKEVYNSKQCNQKNHGSCAAISAARKSLLYEDKKAYIDVLLQELSAEPYLEVYDITRLSEYEKDSQKYERERAPKVFVEKTRINYEAALKDGYRIIDASALQWMKVAGTVGDGTIQVQDYYAFDERHRGFMKDSRVVISLEDEYATEHEFLRGLIKSKKLIKAYDKSIIDSKTQSGINRADDFLLAKMKDEKAELIRNVIRDIVPEYSNFELNNLIKQFENPSNIDTANNEQALRKQVKSYLMKHIGPAREKDIEGKLDELIPLVREYKSLASRMKVGRKTLSSEAKKAERLFKIGLAQREVLSLQLKILSLRERLYADLKMPDRYTQIKDYVRKLKKLAKTKPQSPLVLALKAKNKMDDKSLYDLLDAYDKELSVETPKKLDELLTVYKTSYKDILIRTLKARLNQHRKGDYSYMNYVSDELDFIPDAKKFDKKLSGVIEKLEAAKTNEEVQNAISQLGVHNQIKIISFAIDNSTDLLQGLLVDERLEEVKAMLKGADDLDFYGVCELLKRTNTEVNNCIKKIDEIAQDIMMPSEEDVILRGYEAKGEILTNEALDNLRAKFHKIYKARTEVNDNLIKTGKGKVNPDLYKFSEQEKRHLKQIERKIPKFRRQVKRNYDIMNRSLQEKLDYLYESIGKRKGHFWMFEEVHSGLHTDEQIRIIEQMTGRAYHIEKDIDKAVAHIKSGLGSGVSGTNVDYNDFSGHAQYLADVKPVEIKDAKNNKTIVKDVILHDNTWGSAEQKRLWQGADGLEHTDYKSSLGGPGGFVVSEKSLAGSLVDSYKYDYGMCDYDRDIRAIDGPQTEIEVELVKYGIFNDVILPGEDFRTNRKMQEIISCIFNCNRAESSIEELKKAIRENGYNVNIKVLKEVDEKVSQRVEGVLARLTGTGSQPAMTIEQFNALAENDPLKIIIQRHILEKYCEENNKYETNSARYEDIEEIYGLKTQEQINEYMSNNLKSYKDFLAQIVFKRLEPETKKEILKSLSEAADSLIRIIERNSGKELKGLREELSKSFKEILNLPYNGSGLEVAQRITDKAAEIGKKYAKSNKLELSVAGSLANAIADEMDEILVPESIDAILDQECGESIVHFIDKKFNPQTNEEWMDALVEMVNMTRAEYKKLMKNVTLEDFGIKYDTPENVIRLIQADNSLELKRFKEAARLYYFDDYVQLEEAREGVNKTSKEVANFNNVYRTLSVDIGEIGANKYVQEAKNEVFRKYNARPAIPQVVVVDNETIKNILKENMQTIASKMRDILSSTRLAQYIKEVEDINDLSAAYTETADPVIKERLIGRLNSLKEMLQNEAELKKTYVVTKKLLTMLEKGLIKPADYKKCISKINAEKENITQGCTLDILNKRIIRLKKDLQATINSFIESNFFPKFQSRARGIINDWIRNVIKGVDSDVLIAHTEYCIEGLSGRQVLNEPQELLEYYVTKFCEKRKAADDGDDEISKETIENLEQQLGLVCKKANRAKLEYKLMSAAANGIASKIGDYVRAEKFISYQANGEKKKLNKNDLLGSIISLLADRANNHSSLALFIEQSGLKKEYVDYLTSRKPEYIKYKLEKKLQKLIETANTLNIINQIYEVQKAAFEGIKVTDRKILSDMMREFIQYYEELDSDLPVSAKIIEEYKNNFRKICEKVELKSDYDMVELMDEIHLQCKEIVKSELLSAVNEFNTNTIIPQNHIELMDALSLPLGSEEERKRAEYKKSIEDVVIPFAKSAGQKITPMINELMNS